MTILEFPPIESADRHGLLAIGGDVEVPSLLLAYKNGIFPWPVADDALAWFAPPKRGILMFGDLRIPKSLKRVINQKRFTIEVNSNFDAVIDACSEMINRPGQDGTWITSEILMGYKALHRAGYAVSFEAYQNGRLVGGMYGVRINRYFCGESMFYREPNASKVVLCAAVERLKSEGVTWLDCQMVTPVLETLGAKKIARNEFMKLLKQALEPTPAS